MNFTVVGSAALVLTVFLGSSCSRAKQRPPDVLGISFAGTVADLAPHLPSNAKAERYPLVPIYGYKLAFPNPDNWTVFVQDQAPEDLDENRIFAIAISRDLGHNCSGTDVDQLAGTLEEKYAPLFDASFRHADPDKGNSELNGVTVVAVSRRRMLTVYASCYVQSVGALFSYFDLDRFRYKRPGDIEKMLVAMQTDAREYRSRSLKP